MARAATVSVSVGRPPIDWKTTATPLIPHP